MNIFIESHIKLLKELLNGNVKFLLVGGYAVIFHGYKRTTGDMDLWIEPSNENKQNLLNALKKFDFNVDDIELISNLDFTTYLAFHFWEEPERVDCLTYVNGVSFSEAFEQKAICNIDGIQVPVIQYKHLIISKLSTDRLKDKADVEELQKINKDRNS